MPSSLEQSLLGAILFGVTLFIYFLLIAAYTGRRSHKSTRRSPYPPLVPRGLPILGSVQYFRHRWNFLREATKSGPASFSLAGQHVVALSSQERVPFFSHPRLGFALAYAVMLGAVPSMNRDISRSVGFDITLGGKSNQRLVTLIRRERIRERELSIGPALFLF